MFPRANSAVHGESLISRAWAIIRRAWIIIVVVVAVASLVAVEIAVWALNWSPDIQIRFYTLLAALIALILSIITFLINLDRQFQMKKIDLMRSFQDRYDRIVFEVSENVKDTPDDEKYFYIRYWNLQLEQYQYWRERLIDDGTFGYWMALRREAYKNAIQPFKRRFAMPYKEGWDEAKRLLRLELHNSGDYRAFMDDIFNRADDVESIMHEHRR